MAGPPPADRRLRCVSTTRRIAAKLHRGDAARRLSLSGRALLPAADPGNVWTGLRPRLQQARSLEAPDLHAEREQSLETVLQALAPYQPILTAPVERRPWRLAVRADEITAARRRLGGLPAHWEIREEPRDQQIIARPHLAVADRPFEPIAGLDVMIDVLEREQGRYVGRSQGALRHVPAEDWAALSEQSLRGDARRPCAPEPAVPIDLVYTWVDGSDPAWRERRDAALHARGEGLPARHDSAVDASRFLNSDELRFSLRSVHRYVNWVRRIYIVTDQQVPSWLVREDPRIRIVDHRDLLGGSRFNSHAIESALHRIPGLAEHYLYLNDDVLFGRIAYPSDFFAAEGIAKFFPSDLPIDPGPVTGGDLPIMAAAKNGRDLLASRFGLAVRTKIRHTVHPQLRTIGEQIERENPEAVARTRSALFRSPTDLSLASSLHHWYAYAQGRAVPAQPNYLYVDLAAPGLGQRLDALDSLRRYDTFCLNQEEGAATDDIRRELSTFLNSYLPYPAPWERSAPASAPRRPVELGTLQE